MRGILFCLACWLFLSSAYTTSQAGEIRAGGTGSATALLQILMASFGRESEVTGKVIPHLGSSGALNALADGVLDVAVSGRALRPGEVAKGGEVRPVNLGVAVDDVETLGGGHVQDRF